MWYHRLECRTGGYVVPQHFRAPAAVTTTATYWRVVVWKTEVQALRNAVAETGVRAIGRSCSSNEAAANDIFLHLLSRFCQLLDAALFLTRAQHEYLHMLFALHAFA